MENLRRKLNNFNKAFYKRYANKTDLYTQAIV